MQFNSQTHFSLTRVASHRVVFGPSPRHGEPEIQGTSVVFVVESRRVYRNVEPASRHSFTRGKIHENARARETNVFVSFSFAQWTPEEEDALRDGVAKCVDRSV